MRGCARQDSRPNCRDPRAPPGRDDPAEGAAVVPAPRDELAAGFELRLIAVDDRLELSLLLRDEPALGIEEGTRPGASESPAFGRAEHPHGARDAPELADDEGHAWVYSTSATAFGRPSRLKLCSRSRSDRRLHAVGAWVYGHRHLSALARELHFHQRLRPRYRVA